MAGQGTLPLLRIDPDHDWVRVRAELVHGIRVEADVGVNPQRLLEAVQQGVGGDHVAALVDGGEAADPPDLVSAVLKFLQSVVAFLVDEARKRHEDRALAGVHRMEVASAKGRGVG